MAKKRKMSQQDRMKKAGKKCKGKKGKTFKSCMRQALKK